MGFNKAAAFAATSLELTPLPSHAERLLLLLPAAAAAAIGVVGRAHR